MMRRALTTLVAAAMLAAAPAHAGRGETVRIALIDPLSGPMAAFGSHQLRSFRFVAEKFNRSNPARLRFELLAFDNRMSPAQSLTALRSALDQGVRYIVQGASPTVTAALLDELAGHNALQPGRAALLLSPGSSDPDPGRCSYWQFRFDADLATKADALAAFVAQQPEVRSVYLLNPNHQSGHQFAQQLRDSLARRRPALQIVGEALHPIAQARDFSQQIANIHASGADGVITSDSGGELAQLLRAAHEAGWQGRFYTLHAAAPGTDAGRVYQVSNLRFGAGAIARWQAEFRQRHGQELDNGAVVHLFAALSTAIARARSTDAQRVAAALEGLGFAGHSGEVRMQRASHQLQQPLFLNLWRRSGDGALTLAALAEPVAGRVAQPARCESPGH